MTRHLHTLYAVCLFAGAFNLSAQTPPSEVNTPEDAARVAEAEQAIVARLRDASKRDDSARALLELETKGLRSKALLIAERAIAACGALKNEDEHGRAFKLAERAVKKMGEAPAARREEEVERLYLEAILVGQFIYDRERAVKLLRQAQALSPDDERLKSELLYNGATQ